jgi:hypothetical protein
MSTNIGQITLQVQEKSKLLFCIILFNVTTFFISIKVENIRTDWRSWNASYKQLYKCLYKINKCIEVQQLLWQSRLYQKIILEFIYRTAMEYLCKVQSMQIRYLDYQQHWLFLLMFLIISLGRYLRDGKVCFIGIKSFNFNWWLYFLRIFFDNYSVYWIWRSFIQFYLCQD